MATIDERAAFLEGAIVEQAANLNGIRDAMMSLELRVDRRFEGVDERFLSLETKMDRRFELVDQRFTGLEDKIDRRFELVDRRLLDLDEKLDRKVDALDAKISRHFTWLVGIIATAMAAMLATVAAR